MSRITNDETYQRSLEWLVAKSLVLSNPLVTEDEKEALQGKYEAVAHECVKYRMPHILPQPKVLDDFLE